MRSPARRIAILVGAAAVLVVFFLVLRGRDDDEAAGPRETTVTAVATTGPRGTIEPTTTTTAASAGPRRIGVTVADGRVAGGVKTVAVEQNERIVLVVRADVSDEIHVHGYDRMADVAPGAPAQIGLRATIPGRFDVELEERKLRILELDVRP